MFNISGNNITCRQLRLSNTLRQLWNEHVLWTRFFLVSTAFDLPDLSLVTERLLQNPVDFEKELQPFYGKQEAAEFKQLLTDHLLIASALVNAAKAGNEEEAANQRRLWYNNAADIAKLLGSINPFWSERIWKDMLFDHLQMLEDEAVFILTGEYEKGIKIYDDIQAQALKMADEMTCGIIRQFRIR